MPSREKGEGSIYFNKQRKNWLAQYYEYDIKKDKKVKKTKTFKTDEDAKRFLNTIMYQKENPIYIEHHGIPLIEILKSNLRLKLETNQIGAAQHGRIVYSIKQLEKSPIGNKNIDKINSDEIQSYFNSLKDLSNSMIE